MDMVGYVMSSLGFTFLAFMAKATTVQDFLVIFVGGGLCLIGGYLVASNRYRYEGWDKR